MRFLVTVMPRDPVPPEIGLALVGAMKAFSEKYKDKTEQDWAFAGLAGGGAILTSTLMRSSTRSWASSPSGPSQRSR